MKRMLVFTRPCGSRFAVVALDIRQVYQREKDNSCQVFYRDFGDTESAEIVIDAFDDILAQIEGNFK